MSESAQARTSFAPRASTLAKVATIVALALVAVLATRRLYRSPYSASDLHTTPDEVEYAVCAQRVATLGRYDMDVDGAGVPPHSTPWFSVLLAPAYLVDRGELGNGIWIVLAFAVIGVMVVHRIATLMSGTLGGAFAVIAVLCMPFFTRPARLIMTDTPGAVLGLICLWLFLRRNAHKPRVRESLMVGVLVALAFAIRSVYVFLLVPFVWDAWRARDRRGAHGTALLAPLVAVLGANAVYNYTTFGDWHRTGYQFWLAVPYDYPDLVVSLSYLRTNLEAFNNSEAFWPLGLGALGLLAILVRRPQGWRDLLGFGTVTVLPILVVHLLYFFPGLRFHMYLLTLSTLLGAIGLASLVPTKVRDHPQLVLLALALLVGALFVVPPLGDRMRWFFPDGTPPRRATADLVQQATPEGCVVISDVDPIYMAALAPFGSQRTYLAISRSVEFASKVLVRKRIERGAAAPSGPLDHAAPGLLAHGARWAIPHTADEMHAQIDAWVRGGRPVFIATIHPPDEAALARVLGDTLRAERTGARMARVVAAR